MLYASPNGTGCGICARMVSEGGAVLAPVFTWAKSTARRVFCVANLANLSANACVGMSGCLETENPPNTPPTPALFRDRRPRML